MNNDYTNFSHPENAVQVTPDDGTDLLRSGILYIGSAGDVTVDLKGLGTNVTFTGVQQGFFPLEVARVYSTGTTADSIIVLY